MVDDNPAGSTTPWWQKNLKVLVAGCVVLGLLLAWFLVNNSVTNEGNKQQNGLNAQYEDNINYLSDCIVRVNGVANVAKAQAATFQEVLVEVVKGRYDNELQAATPGESSALISAIFEDYPDMRPLTDAFMASINILNGCRTDYRNIQTKLLTRVNSFENWRTGSWTVRNFGGEYPTNGLRARAGDSELTGEAALKQMRTVIVVGEASDAYATGELEAPDPFGVNPSG